MYCSILNLYTYIYTYHMHMIQVSAEKTNSPIPIASRNCASIPFCFAIWRKNRRIQSWNPVFFQSWDDIIDIIWWHPHMWLPQFWKELAPSLKTSFSPQHGYTVLPIHSTYSCEEKMALAFRNETNPEPLGTLSGHKPRGSCEPCGCFPVPSCTQIFHQQKNMWREFSEKLLMLALSSTTVWKTSRPCRRGKGIKHLSLIDASMPGSCWITLPHLKSRHSL